ncbi:MAG: hypothetical protein ACRCUP_05230 [Mycoplasmatales bacterium]
MVIDRTCIEKKGFNKKVKFKFKKLVFKFTSCLLLFILLAPGYRCSSETCIQTSFKAANEQVTYTVKIKQTEKQPLKINLSSSSGVIVVKSNNRAQNELKKDKQIKVKASSIDKILQSKILNFSLAIVDKINIFYCQLAEIIDFQGVNFISIIPIELEKKFILTEFIDPNIIPP